MIGTIEIDVGKLVEASLIAAVFGVGVVVSAGVAVVASLRAQDRRLAQQGGALAYQAVCAACVVGIVAAIALALYVMIAK
jgi:hypothetical protein